MKFKKSFKILFIWRRKYRQLIRRWQENFLPKDKKKLMPNYFSWKQKINYRQVPWYWQKTSTHFKK
jgi:hypothetical protein